MVHITLTYEQSEILERALFKAQIVAEETENQSIAGQYRELAAELEFQIQKQKSEYNGSTN
jgi:hypothetical protein